MPNISLPHEYKSVFGPINYNISGLDPETVNDIDVINAETSKILGTKRYFNCESAEMNIASYLRRAFDIKPMLYNTTCYFNKAYNRSVSAAVQTGQTISDTQMFLASIVDCQQNQMLSNMLKRTISANECDEISFLLNQSDISATIEVNCSNSCSFTVSQSGCTKGIWTLLVSMDEIARRANGAQVNGFKVTVSIDSQAMYVIDYTVVRASEDAVRLCWLNTLGTIDSHTFRNIQRYNIENSKQRILTESGYRTIDSTANIFMELRSDFYPIRQTSAICEVICSPSVWIMRGNRIQPVDIVTDKLTIGTDSLTAIELKVRESKMTHYQSF